MSNYLQIELSFFRKIKFLEGRWACLGKQEVSVKIVSESENVDIVEVGWYWLGPKISKFLFLCKDEKCNCVKASNIILPVEEINKLHIMLPEDELDLHNRKGCCKWKKLEILSERKLKSIFF